MQRSPTLEPAEHVAPASFACAYLNGRADSVPPLLLALDGLEDVAAASIAELLPTAYAEKTAPTALVALSFFVGCAVMATSLLLGA